MFVEDEGDILFYKNSRGFAATRPVFMDTTASDSGIELDDLPPKKDVIELVPPGYNEYPALLVRSFAAVCFVLAVSS